MRHTDSKKVLIVEDEIIMAQEVSELLGHFDVCCDIANQYEFSQSVCEKFLDRYLVIITDLFMPDYNGGQVLHDVRKFSPEIVVILMSATPEHTLEHFDYIIRKPVRMAHIEDMVIHFNLPESLAE